jgi:peptide/nickel transport system ATP-binding protein
MRQRVMIAMALSCDPRLVIADEPTTALDVTIQSQILDLLARMRETFDTAVLLITHDLGVVAETADRVAVMYAGRIVETADIYSLFDTPAHPYTRGLIASIPRMDQPVAENKRLATISGVVPALYALPTGCPFRDRCPEAFSPCGESEPPLFTLSNDHQARCWLHGDRTTAADR